MSTSWIWYWISILCKCRTLAYTRARCTTLMVKELPYKWSKARALNFFSKIFVSLQKICPFKILFQRYRWRKISNYNVFIQQISMNAVTTVRSVAQPRVSTLWGSTGVSVSRATPSKTATAQVKFYTSTNLLLENLILLCPWICRCKENQPHHMLMNRIILFQT